MHGPNYGGSLRLSRLLWLDSTVVHYNNSGCGISNHIKKKLFLKKLVFSCFNFHPEEFHGQAVCNKNTIVDEELTKNDSKTLNKAMIYSL